MRIAIVGAGAIGSYYGACLSQAGHSVVFQARGAHGEAMRETGLRVTGPGVSLHIRRPELFDAADAGPPADLVLVCTKLPDTEAALSDAAPLIAPGALGLSLQNGIDAARLLARHFAPGQVLLGTTYIFASIAGPGEIELRAPLARIAFGEPDGPVSERCRDLLAALDVPGIEASLRDDMTSELWRKFSFVAPHAAAGSFYRSTVGMIRSDPDRRELFTELVREAVAIGRSQGAELPQGTVESILIFLDGLPPEAKASMLVDLERGKRLELEWLTGAVVRLGEGSGFPVPESRRVYEALRPFADGGQA